MERQQRGEKGRSTETVHPPPRREAAREIGANTQVSGGDSRLNEAGRPSFSLCRTSELQEGERRKFVVNGNEVLLVKIDGEIFAVEPMCTHDGTDISRGKFDPVSGIIECQKHFARFDIRTGIPLVGPFGADGDTQPPLRLYKIRIENDYVHLEANQEWGVI
ncbi:MAG: Rieske (2Fe-2S) protein [Thaumarchaeota archaeon]|nr:MAG: Rieske (2Fe-2S) protein [Nitrososphaerota archaeon]